MNKEKCILLKNEQLHDKIDNLEQQLQTAKEENEKLMEQLNTKYLEWEETFMENQRLKEENEKLKDSADFDNKLLDLEKEFRLKIASLLNCAEGTEPLTIAVEQLTQQNKQMRVAINNIKNLCNEDWEDMTVDKFQNQLLQALKGVE